MHMIDTGQLFKRQVIWQGAHRRSLMDLLNNGAVELETSCGGKGQCGKCKVRVLAGDCSPLTDEEKYILTAEELALGTRLACCCEGQGKYYNFNCSPGKRNVHLRERPIAGDRAGNHGPQESD